MAFNGFTEDQYQPIGDMYDGKSIFVTGSTGFLGKVFVEKLLYRCPKIGKVYILIRDTDSVSAVEKFKKMLNCPIFKRLREEKPEYLEKIIPIVGDISKPNLGIKIADEKLLIENVSMVFHFAATIKFNEPLQVAINLNVEGTRRMLDLCLKLKNIQVFLYVSTAFSNANRKMLDEVLYPPPIAINDIDRIMEQHSFTEEETVKVLNGIPNTYVLTKAVAENMVAKFRDQQSIPTIIVRPSIVISCKDEPMGGWIDNWLGATPLIMAVAKGLIRTLRGNGSNNIDLIPADYVANLTIVAAARSQRSKGIQIYNSCSSAANPITLRKLNNISMRESIKHKFNDLPYPGLFFVQSKWLMTIIIFLLETLPAYLADCVMCIMGKKQTYMKLQSRVTEVRKALEPFTSRTWYMKSQNATALYNSLSSSDRLIFSCDAAIINWDELIPIYFNGIRRYLLNMNTK